MKKIIKTLLATLSSLAPIVAKANFKLSLSPIVIEKLSSLNVDSELVTEVLETNNINPLDVEDVKFNKETNTIDISDFDGFTIHVDASKVLVAQPNADT